MRSIHLSLDGRAGQAAAFTRTDLLGLVMGLGLLLLLEIKGAGVSRADREAAECLNHKQRLTEAWRLYADDNHGQLVGNLDGGDTQSTANAARTWVIGWLDFTGNPANTNTLYLTQYSPLAPYTGRAAEVFKCPADLSLSRGSTGLPRVRSLSMNGYLGARSTPYTAGYRQFPTTESLVGPPPSELMVFFDEHEQSINDGWFAVDMTGFDPASPTQLRLIDYPAAYHLQGAGISFADGRAEIRHWTDSRTILKPGQLPSAAPTPNNADVRWLQSHASSRQTQR